MQLEPVRKISQRCEQNIFNFPLRCRWSYLFTGDKAAADFNPEPRGPRNDWQLGGPNSNLIHGWPPRVPPKIPLFTAGKRWRFETKFIICLIDHFYCKTRTYFIKLKFIIAARNFNIYHLLTMRIVRQSYFNYLKKVKIIDFKTKSCLIKHIFKLWKEYNIIFNVRSYSQYTIYILNHM